MFDLIKGYEVNGAMDEDQKREILEILEWLTVFANGYSEHLAGHNNWNDLLTIWVIKMEIFGWAQKKIAYAIGDYARTYNGYWNKTVHKQKLELKDYTKYPQHETKERVRKQDLVYFGTLTDNPDSMAKGNAKNDILKSERQKVIDGLSKIQLEYLPLWEARLLPKEISEILKRDIKTVYKMVRELNRIFSDVETEELNEPGTNEVIEEAEKIITTEAEIYSEKIISEGGE